MLFAACTKAGALSVGASDEKAESARLFGEYIGLCFQIKDDIFDYSESKEIGKPTGNDMVEGKLTLPVLHVLNTVKNKTAEEIAVKIKNGEATPSEIAHLIEFTKQHGGIEYASQVMYDYKEKALSLLASLPRHGGKSSASRVSGLCGGTGKMTELFPVDNMKKPDGTHSIRLYL